MFHGEYSVIIIVVVAAFVSNYGFNVSTLLLILGCVRSESSTNPKPEIPSQAAASPPLPLAPSGQHLPGAVQRRPALKVFNYCSLRVGWVQGLGFKV